VSWFDLDEVGVTIGHTSVAKMMSTLPRNGTGLEMTRFELHSFC